MKFSLQGILISENEQQKYQSNPYFNAKNFSFPNIENHKKKNQSQKLINKSQLEILKQTIKMDQKARNDGNKNKKAEKLYLSSFEFQNSSLNLTDNLAVLKDSSNQDISIIQQSNINNVNPIQFEAILSQKEKEIEKLKRKLNIMKNQKKEDLKNVQLLLKGDKDFEVSTLSKEHLIILLNETQKQYNSLQTQCFNFDKLQDNNTSIQEKSDLIYKLSLELGLASKQEIELNFKSRNLKQCQIGKQLLNGKVNSLIQCIGSMKNEKEALQMQNAKYKLKLEIEKTSRKKMQQQVKDLQLIQQKYEKRLEFVLENELNMPINQKDQMRNCITELLKENENLKRELQQSKLEIKRLNEKVGKLQETVQRLNKRLQRKIISGNETFNSGGLQFTSQTIKKSIVKSETDPMFLLSKNQIPYTLDFRFNQIKQEYLNILIDLQEYGSIEFSNQVMKREDKQRLEDLTFIASSFLSVKEFSEKLNLTIHHLINAEKQLDIKEFMIFTSKRLPEIFPCEVVQLWLLDSMTGALYSYNLEKKHKRCLIGRGLFGEVMRTKIPLNKRDAKQKMLYQDIESEEPRYVNSTLIFPLQNEESKVIGIFEISNILSDIFGFEEEYFGIIMSKYIQSYINKNYSYKILQIELKYKFLIYDSFNKLVKCKSKFAFQEEVKTQIASIFGINTSIFYFVEEDYLVQYNESKIVTRYSIQEGICGSVAKNQHQIIISDVNTCKFFNKFIDIQTLLPLFVIPFLEPKIDERAYKPQFMTKAVLSVVLKYRTLQSNEKENEFLKDISIKIGIDEPLENQLKQFVNFANSALKINFT